MDIGNSHIGIGIPLIGGIAENITNMGREYAQVIAGGNLSALSPAALRIFLRMAIAVMDSDNPETGEIEGIYYGGWKSLTYVLGHGIYEKNEPLPVNVERQIERGIRELRRAGYLVDVPEELQREHSNRVYRLNIVQILYQHSDRMPV